MNRNLSLVLVAAAVCGLALAQTPQQRSDAEKLAALQKRVETLEAELTSLKQVKPGAGAEFEAALGKDRQTLESVVKYMTAESTAAEKLQAVLADSKDKGFTFGINPDSRIVLLQGFHDFAETLKVNLPSTEPEPAKNGVKH